MSECRIAPLPDRAVVRVTGEAAPNFLQGLITNDVDEAILLADRLIPLTAVAPTTMGPCYDIAIDRPRDRRMLNRDPHFKHLRNEVFDYLLEQGRQTRQRSKPVPTRQEEVCV